MTQASGRGSNIEYRYSATANDGRITSRKDNVSGEEVSYQYDQLGRLIAASTTGPGWGLAWGYDGFGNRLQQNVTKGTGPSAVFNVDPATNRMTGAGINYDANGNMTGFGTGSGTATYDLFNRMVNVTTGNGTEWYGYSAANQRIQVSRANGTFETFFYGLGGELLGVYQRGTKANGHYYFSSASIRVWFAGRLIDGGGSSMVTDRLGSVVKNGTEALSYYPYGEQRTGNAAADREKFATYTRDAVSGLDYAWNRYYSSESGRFNSADPYRASGRVKDPMSWNRYTYVKGDPLNAMDTKGLAACWADPFWIDPFIGVTSPIPCGHEDDLALDVPYDGEETFTPIVPDIDCATAASFWLAFVPHVDVVLRVLNENSYMSFYGNSGALNDNLFQEDLYIVSVLYNRTRQPELFKLGAKGSNSGSIDDQAKYAGAPYSNVYKYNNVSFMLNTMSKYGIRTPECRRFLQNVGYAVNAMTKVTTSGPINESVFWWRGKSGWADTPPGPMVKEINNTRFYGLWR